MNSATTRPPPIFDHRLLQDSTFAVVDPSMHDSLPEDTMGTLMVPRALEGSAHLMPSLLDLRTLTSVQSAALLQSLDDTLAQQEAPPLSIFISTTVDLERYVLHWNAMQLHRAPSPRFRWLRVHDTRVLHQLLRILAPDQIARLFGPATKMTYCLHGEWLQVEKPQFDVSTGSSLNWDWHRIERIGLVNRSLARAGVQSPAMLTRQGARAEQLIDHAEAGHRLEHADDLVEFAYRGLGCVQQFDEHPSLRALIHSTDDDDDSLLIDRWALVEPSVWSELALPKTDTPQGDA